QVRYGQISFREVRERIHKYQRGLNELGLAPRDRVLMLVSPGVDFLALSYAVMGRGAIPIFLDPGMGKENLFQTIREIDPQVLIGSPRAQLLRLKKRDLMPNLKFHVTASEWIYTGGPRLGYLKRFSPKPLPFVEVRDPLFVAYTSGATGKPKGVEYTNEMLTEQLRILRESFGLQPEKKDLPLLPIFSLFHLANGVCSVFPNIDPSRPLSLDPERVLKIIHDLEVNYSFGSPTLWNKISEYCVRAGDSLGSLEKIFMAGAPVPRSVLSRVQEVLGESGEVFTPYGATEALPVTLASAAELEREARSTPDGSIRSTCGAEGIYVGHPVAGVSVRVIQRLDAPVVGEARVRDCEIGEIGEVIVSGNNVSRKYYQNPEATRNGKLDIQGMLWHRMGDVGYRNADGGLYFCGRVAHIVQSPTRTYYSVPTELIFNRLEKVRRSALVDLGEGEEPGIVIEPHPEHWPETEDRRRAFLKELEEVAKQNEITQKIHWFFFHPSFPVDGRHNAKIFRDKLGDWARQFVTKQEAA
ncbi:MAG: AMP-binding protein, partial [Bdellovibrionales bacterium]|nr:AMP-binding protein [Bdellovibrionales bacterium]